MSETVQTTRKLNTPRRIAWALLLVVLIWFVVTSPKTPLQFFDAANRDEVEFDTITKQRSDQIPSKRARTLQDLKSVHRKMNRMALAYDITHNPARVQQERTLILLGSYDASPQTHEAMMRNNDTYRSVAGQFGKLKMDLKASREPKSDSIISRHAQEEDKDLRMKRFQAEIDRMTLRRFQAKFFWRAHQ